MQNKGPALAPVSLSPTSLIPGSPPKFSSTVHWPDEKGTALQPRTLANEADFFEQAPSRILPFLKPQRQTPCNRTVVLPAATVYARGVRPRNFTGTLTRDRHRHRNLKSAASVCLTPWRQYCSFGFQILVRSGNADVIQSVAVG